MCWGGMLDADIQFLTTQLEENCDLKNSKDCKNEFIKIKAKVSEFCCCHKISLSKYLTEKYFKPMVPEG